MYGLNPFAQGIDPLELLKVKGLLGNTFQQPPMAPQPMQPQPQMAQVAPEPPPMVAPQGGPPITPEFPVVKQPEAQPMVAPVPMPPRRPESFGPQGGLPSLVGQPLPNMGPESATPEQRQMAASSAGKPQDVRPDGAVGFDGALEKMMSDPLFHMGVALLANPRNPGQGLASGLQNWGVASRQAKADKRAQEALNRKNIHWSTINGQLVGVDMDNPGAPVIIPGGQPQKQMYETIEQDGAKYQRDPESGRLFPLQTPDQPDKYEVITGPDGSPIGQRNVKTGKVEDYPGAKGSGEGGAKVVGEGQQLVGPDGKVIFQGQQKIPAALQKELSQAEEGAFAAKQSINTLKELQARSKKAWGNALAPKAAPILAPFSQGAQDTVILDNMATGEALNSLKSTFGGMPTEGERKILIDIQGSSALPDSVRQEIYKNALNLISSRSAFNKAKAQAIADGSYRDPNSAFSKKYREYIDAESGDVGGGGVTGSVESDPAAAAGSPIDKAREAISRGAPRDAVIQRLRQAGYDTTGL